MYNERSRAFTAGADLAAKRRVKLKAATTTTPPEVEYAGAGEAHIGITETWANNGDGVSILLANASGSMEMTAAGAFALGADIYGAASGKVDDTASGSSIGTALEAATADGDVIEVLPV